MPRIPLTRRSPFLALLLSLIAPGTGQIYNKQLEKAVLIWIWYFILFVTGVALLLLGMAARWLPSKVPPPPLSAWVHDHAGAVFALWGAALGILWLANACDAFVSAPRINSGRVVIPHPMRWQAVHVLGSQLLGMIPFIGLFFPPGIVAEAVDACKEGRSVSQDKVLREGGSIVLQWVLTRIAFYAVWVVVGAWVFWWILRALRWLP
jgi:hypothetical protein